MGFQTLAEFLLGEAAFAGPADPQGIDNPVLLRSVLLSLLPRNFPSCPLPIVKEQLYANPASCLPILRSN